MFTACEKGNNGLDPEGKSKYTVIVYANGGDNIDADIESDLNRAAEAFEKRSKDLSVRMIVCMKYSNQSGLQKQIDKNLEDKNKLYIPAGKPSTVYMYELTAEYNSFPEKEGVAQYLPLLPDSCKVQGGRFPMFSPKGIAQVLQRAAKMAPAQNYVMLFAGHAGGWGIAEDGEYPAANKMPASAVTDPHYKGRAIKAKELHDGIQQSGLHMGALIFDCCMMNSLEYLSELTDVTDYVLASGHTTKGSNLGQLVTALFNANDLENALKEQARNNKNYHTEVFDTEKDPRGMNTDFAVVKLSGLPSVWSGMQGIVNYMCANVKDSAKYVIPSTKCYQYYNEDCKYDLMDYLTLLKAAGAPYDGDEEYNNLYKALETAVSGAIVAHEEAHHFIDGYKPAHALSFSVNMGAKGRVITDFKPSEELFGGYESYDNKGRQWIYSPSTKEGQSDMWVAASETNPKYNWEYSYGKSVFDAKTGWTKWMIANPAIMFGNPPYGDDGDNDGMDDTDDAEEEEDEFGDLY